jgi:hypothetical protein
MESFTSQPDVASTVYVEVDPHWHRDALSLPLVKKVRAMGAALWLFARAPRVFGEAWFRGDARIPNPAVAMATAVSILTLFAQETTRVLKRDGEVSPFVATLGETLGPYALYISMGLVAHVLLRLLGSKRRLRTTIGISLLAGAGPGMIVAFSMMPTLAVVARYGLEGVNDAAPMWLKLCLAVLVVVAYVHFVVAFELALAGAHSLPRWRGVVAGTLAIVVMAFVTGRFEESQRFAKYARKLGPHLSLTIPFHVAFEL